MPSPNLFYALRIDGLFAEVKTRSIPKQANYRPILTPLRSRQGL
jgi:alpha-acetolactate decarboxylase